MQPDQHGLTDLDEGAGYQRAIGVRSEDRREDVQGIE